MGDDMDEKLKPVRRNYLVKLRFWHYTRGNAEKSIMNRKINITFLLVLLLMMAYCAHAASVIQLGEGGIELQGFRTSGSSVSKSPDDGTASGDTLDWELTGKNALMQQPIFQLNGVTLKMQSRRGRYIVSSPQCTFDQQKREIRSNAAVQMSGPGIDVTGIGYDLFWENEAARPIFVIRKAAHIVIQLDAVHSVKEQL
jgi:hypothetical protein